jgi:hypothetical protein
MTPEIERYKDTSFKIGERECRTIRLDIDKFPFKIMLERREDVKDMFDVRIERGLENGRYERAFSGSYKDEKEEDELVVKLIQRCQNMIIPFDLDHLEMIRYVRRKIFSKRRAKKNRDDDE